MSGKILSRTILKSRVIKTISLKSLVISLVTLQCSKMEFKIIYSKNNCLYRAKLYCNKITIFDFINSIVL